MKQKQTELSSTLNSPKRKPGPFSASFSPGKQWKSSGKAACTIFGVSPGSEAGRVRQTAFSSRIFFAAQLVTGVCAGLGDKHCITQ